ncbi:MAG: glycosyltransferase [Anaerolineales bacterium]|nr:glycosyltransferase [Anaerolineales bacterium]
MKILFLTKYLPYPTNYGYAMRVYNLILQAAGKHEVSLVSMHNGIIDDQVREHLSGVCKRLAIIPVETQPALSIPGQIPLYLLKGIPPELRLNYNQVYMTKVVEFIREENFDLIQIEESGMGIYLEYLPKDIKAKTSVTFIDIEAIKYGRIYQYEPGIKRKLRLWVFSQMLKNWEPKLAKKADLGLVMSDVDKAYLEEKAPGANLVVVPNGIDLKKYDLLRVRNTPEFLFVGILDYLPNIDAVREFCERIFPLIRRELPEAKFTIVGKNPRQVVLDLAGDGVKVVGEVPEVTPYYLENSVSVVPLRAGGGTRLKILESMAYGRPVVSTSIGCEGIWVRNGENILVGDEPELFAEHCIRLVQDPDIYQRIRTGGRELVQTVYDWELIGKDYLKYIERLVGE